MNNWKKYILGCTAGNILQLYDFIIYGYFAHIISVLFFPLKNEFISLLLTLAVFSSGSLVRPFSSLILGHLGDKYGRRVSLIISIGLMTVATALMGLIPTYSTIGILAPILLLICRILQSLAMSSEEVGAAIFLMENAPYNQRAYACSLILGSVFIGLLAGSLISIVITYWLTTADLYQWGWRLPFIFSAFFGFIALTIRIKQPESAEFATYKNNSNCQTYSTLKYIQVYSKSIIKIALISSLMGTSVYMLAVYIPSFLNSKTSLKLSSVMMLCSYAFALTFFLTIIVGKMSDLFVELPPKTEPGN